MVLRAKIVFLFARIGHVAFNSVLNQIIKTQQIPLFATLEISCLTQLDMMTAVIMTAAEVTEYYRISLSTLKRWIMLSRRGFLDFPPPIGAKGSKLRWRREDIERWNSAIGNVPTQPAAEIETPSGRKRQNEKVAKGLEKLGITIYKKGK